MSGGTRRRGGFSALLLASAVACAPGPSEPGGDPVEAPPALVVLIVVDQMRADYLERFEAEWRGGFARLLAEGRVFTEAHLDYAVSETACGHATLVTGRFPRSHRVAGNKWFDRDLGKIVESVEDPAHPVLGSDTVGRSAARLAGTSLAHWMRDRWPDSRIVALSRKDRSAIWLAGGQGDHIYWFDPPTGRATSSTAFRDTLPEFVERFNREVDLAGWGGRVWESTLEPGRAYPGVREDDFAGENASRLGRVFPHVLPRDRTTLLHRVTLTPFMDELVLDLATRAVATLELGDDETPDLLAVSLGATDEVGHLFGPHSVEVADQLLRLDLRLGEFLSELERRVGRERLLVALTADHGVPPVPAESRRQGRSGARYVDMEALAGRIDEALGEVHGEGRYVAGIRPIRLWLDHDLLAERGVDLATARELARSVAAATPGIARGYVPEDLAADPAVADDPWLRQARRSYVPERVGDLLLVLEPYCLPADAIDVTTHMSPHAYDTHVPLIFAGSGIAPGRVPDRVATVDVAPTLARILGVVPGEPLDGRLLPGWDDPR